MTDRDPTPDSVAWLRALATWIAGVAESPTESARALLIADEIERKDAEIVAGRAIHTQNVSDLNRCRAETMLEIGCDLCGGAHHNNQHELIEAGYAKDAEIARLTLRVQDERERLCADNAALAALVRQMADWLTDYFPSQVAKLQRATGIAERAKAALAQTEQK